MLNKALAIIAVILSVATAALCVAGYMKMDKELKAVRGASQALARDLSQALSPTTAKSSDDSKEITSLAQQTQQISSSLDGIRQGVSQLQRLNTELDAVRASVRRLQDFDDNVTRTLDNSKAEAQKLSSAIKELQDRLYKMELNSEVKMPIPEQGVKDLVGKHRFSPRPVDERVLVGLFPGLPEKVVRSKAVVDLEQVHNRLAQNPTVDGFVAAFVALSKAGCDVHLMVGPENPVDRPVWLEVYQKDSLSVLHPSLPLKVWSGIKRRTDLPDMMQNAKFGVFYNTAGARSFYELAGE